MLDIFTQKDVAKLFKNKNIVLMGDSNIRALYKDLLCLLRQTRFISQRTLKTKGESSVFGDTLLTNGPKTNGRCYREERKTQFNGTTVSFYFITRVYDSYVEEILEYVSHKSKMPDVLIINSCLWDVTRWGPNGVQSYKSNLKTLMKELKRLMPNCLVIWVTAPPIACELKGGFLVKELEFLRYSLRFHVMEANHYARKIVVDNGFDVLDSHYHLKLQIHRRCDDGIHWQPSAVRYITNLLLTHISLSWNVTLPHRYKPKNEAVSSPISEDSSVSNSAHSPENNKSKKVSPVKRAISFNESIENYSEVKCEKENYDFDVNPKKKTKSNKKRKRLNRGTHHAYLNRVQEQKRHKRIQKWHSSAPEDHFSNSYQNDSGYFPSPKSLSPAHQIYMPGHGYGSNRPLPFRPHPFSRYSPRMPISSQPMYNTHTSVLQGRHVSIYATNLPSYTSSPMYMGDTRRVICASNSSQNQYDFSNFNRQPIFDFASSDAVPFGVEF